MSADRRRHDPVPSESGSFANASRYRSFSRYEPRHRVGTRAIHPNLAVVIDGHEAEGRIHARVHDVDVEPIALVDRRPVADRRSAERVDGKLQPGPANRGQIDDVREIVDVRTDQVLLDDPARAQRASRA
jgi:hypothetical protein